MPDTAYRTRLPRTRDVEVQVKRWAVREPFRRKNVWWDFGTMCCWLFCAIIDVLRIVIENYKWGWFLLTIHLLCAAAWGLSLRMKLERRTVTETRQITE